MRDMVMVLLGAVALFWAGLLIANGYWWGWLVLALGSAVTGWFAAH